MCVDEETGCSVNNQYLLSIRRRWNYENNCAAVICYVSTGDKFKLLYILYIYTCTCAFLHNTRQVS